MDIALYRKGFVIRYLPMLAYLLTFTSTCLVGALLLLADSHPFVDLFEYFTGVRVPVLSEDKVRLTLFLLFVPPAALLLGFACGEASARRIPFGPARRFASNNSSPHAAIATFSVCAVLACASLVGSGAFGNIQTWLSYESWINARIRNFQTLSFFEFVNIYTFLPLAAGWVTVSVGRPLTKSRLLRWTPLVLTVVLSLLLYQKKAAIVALILVLATWLFHSTSFDRRAVARRLTAISSGLIAIYFAAVVVPTLGPVLSQPAPTTAPALIRDWPRATGIVLYAALAPLTRTSAPALYYSIVYPDEHPWYGLDVGQDLLCPRRLGCPRHTVPDDNVVVWNYMNPNLPGGMVAAPFQFGLYSQVGMIGAVAGALVLGAAVGAIWSIVTSGRLSAVWASLLAAITLVLGIYLAIDSPRPSLLASYGLVWAGIFVLLASIVHRIAVFVESAWAGRRTISS